MPFTSLFVEDCEPGTVRTVRSQATASQKSDSNKPAFGAETEPAEAFNLNGGAVLAYKHPLLAERKEMAASPNPSGGGAS